jgi:hypothetical protein
MPAPPASPARLQVGDAFVLNCLGEGEYNKTMKHFLQVRAGWEACQQQTVH